MIREVAKKTQFEEAGRQREAILLFLAILLPQKGFLFGGREMNRAEDGSRNLVWEIRRMKHLELMLREISSR